MPNFTEMDPPVPPKRKEARLRCVLAPFGQSLVILMVILADSTPLAGTAQRA